MNARSGRPALDASTLLDEAQWVRRLARKLVRDDAVAEDVVQETWLAALASAPDAGRLRPWLARVVRNFAAQSRRGDAHRAGREERSARPERTPSASETVERLEAQRLLVEALAALDEPYRTTVTQRYLEGLSAAQIARKEKIPAGTVRWRLKQGLDDLRARLDARFEGERRSWAVLLFPFVRRPPIAQIVAGGAAAAVEGVVMMNTVTKVGIAAALVATATVGVWIGVGSTNALSPAPVAGPAAPENPALDARPAEATEHALATVPAEAGRETALAPEPAPAAKTGAATASLSTKGRLEARFLDAGDRPVEGVRVTLESFPSLPELASAADGRAGVDVEIAAEGKDTQVVGEHAGLATYFGRALLQRGRTTYLGDVRLAPGGSVSGVVLGLDGNPAAGARVLVTAPASDRGIEQSRVLGPLTPEPCPSGRTLSDGTFRVDGIRLGPVRVWAGADDTRWSCTEPVDLEANPNYRGVELRLNPFEKTDVICGIVLTPEGNPVPSADVRFTGKSRGSTNSGNFSAGKDGRFRYRVQIQGDHDFQVHDASGRWPDASALAVQPGTQDLVLQFPLPRWIEISVRDRAGEPITEFAAVVFSEDKKRTLVPGTLAAHEKGKVALLVPAEPFVVDVRARGHGNATLGPWSPREAPSSESCRLDTLPGVRGQVRVNGEPLANAKVELFEIADEHSSIDRNGFRTRLFPDAEDTTTTDAQGWFQLDPTRPGESDDQRFFQTDAAAARPVAILCSADGWALAEVSPLALDPKVGIDGIRIDLVAGGALEGKVLTAPGKEPAGVVVGLDRHDGKPRTQRVAPDGRFRFDRLTPGKYLVTRVDDELHPGSKSTSWSSGLTARTEYSTNCSVDDGKTTRFDLDLRDDGPCVVLADVVVNGSPATGWTGLVRTADSTSSHKTTGGAVDAQGRLRVEVSEPGKYVLALRPPSSGKDGATFEMDLDLRRGDNAMPVAFSVGGVRGQCAAAPDSTLLQYDAGKRGAITCFSSAKIGEGGRFEMPCVLAGAGFVNREEYRADGGIHGDGIRAPVDVPVGGTAEVTVP